MNLLRRTNQYWPFDEFERLRDEINDLFELDRYPQSTGLFDRSVSPRMDVVETGDEFVVACDLPGLGPKDIDLDITNNILTIRGEKKQESKDKQSRKNYRSETWYGSFQRTMSLPETVNPDSVSAELKNGVLAVRIGKREEHKPKRISVKVK
jgi:HSP20 family protein